MAESEFEVGKSEVIGIDGKTITKTIEITRKPNAAPDDTYFGVTAQILAVPPEGQDGLTREQAIAAIVKRFGHFEKRSVYERLWRYFKDEISKDSGFKEFVELKRQTHREFSLRPLDMQIWGQGKWKDK